MRDERKQGGQYYPGGGVAGGSAGGEQAGVKMMGAYAIDEETGLYHKLKATKNEYDEVTLEIEQEGVTI